MDLQSQAKCQFRLIRIARIALRRWKISIRENIFDLSSMAHHVKSQEVDALPVATPTILNTTQVAIKQALPADDFKKLDAYVSSNYIYPRSPGQLINRD